MDESTSEQIVEVPEPFRSVVRPRVGVVLAAGRSQRLRQITRGGSKALIALGGMTLVERAIRGLLACGLEQVVVVVGYHAGPVGTIVNGLALGRVHAVFAEGREAGNGASLAAAESFVGEEELFVLVTADHVFGPPERPLPPNVFEVGIGLREHARGKGHGREARAAHRLALRACTS